MFRYRGVLKTEIQEFVATSMCKTFDAMVEAEQEPVPVKKSKGQKSDGRKEFSGCPKCWKNHSGECRLPEPVCFKCGKPGHRSRECRVEPRTCFHCFQPGHIKPNCPQLVGVASTPAPTPLMITNGSTGKKSGSTTGGRGRVFQLTAEETETDVVIGVYPVNKKPALVLFDIKDFRLERDRSASSLAINLVVEEVWGCKVVYRGCSLVIHGIPLTIDLIPTPMSRIDVKVGERLNYIERPVVVLELKVKRLRIKEIVLVKVQWQHRKGSEWTWEPEAEMRERYPGLFSQTDFGDEILGMLVVVRGWYPPAPTIAGSGGGCPTDGGWCAGCGRVSAGDSRRCWYRCCCFNRRRWRRSDCVAPMVLLRATATPAWAGDGVELSAAVVVMRSEPGSRC
ncbi:hypothetical protein OSB04_018903 [Centaurea solstitialis]|uniref:CCHC-type domain-containing protein n=1 Tax=Centaurea solstitialis TaxID=347529 RepID=A0AA38SP88_9ASTR|nr:hypothetical protein OSB04_018903 [Centaurea solstitialis]